MPSPIITKNQPAHGQLPSGYQPIPLELIRNSLDLDSLDPCNLGPGPSSVLRVRRYGACLAFGCPWSGGLAAVQLAPAPLFNGRVLAGRSLAGLCKAPLARPVRPKTRCMAGFSKRCVVSLIH